MEPSQELEALQPELSQDTFELCGKTIKIKPLKLKYQAELAQVLAPVIGDAAYQVVDYTRLQGVLSLFGHALRHYDIFIQFLAILAKNDGIELSEAELGESDIQLDEIESIIKRFIEKDVAIGVPVSRFFQTLKTGVGLQYSQVMKALESLKAINFTFADSLPDSVNPTGGDLTTV